MTRLHPTGSVWLDLMIEKTLWYKTFSCPKDISEIPIDEIKAIGAIAERLAECEAESVMKK